MLKEIETRATECGRVVPADLRTLDLYQVAEALQIDYQAARYRARLGMLPGAFRLGRLWRVRYVEFKRWLDKGCPD